MYPVNVVYSVKSISSTNYGEIKSCIALYCHEHGTKKKSRVPNRMNTGPACHDQCCLWLIKKDREIRKMNGIVLSPPQLARTVPEGFQHTDQILSS